MDNNNAMAAFVTVVALVIFSFIFSFQALYDANQFSMVLAFIGFLLSAAISLIYGFGLQQEGAALALWFWILLGVILTMTIWYTTRVGNAAGWL